MMVFYEARRVSLPLYQVVAFYWSYAGVFPRNAVPAKMYVQSDKRINHGHFQSSRQLKIQLSRQERFRRASIFAAVYTPSVPEPAKG